MFTQIKQRPICDDIYEIKIYIVYYEDYLMFAMWAKMCKNKTVCYPIWANKNYVSVLRRNE